MAANSKKEWYFVLLLTLLFTVFIMSWSPLLIEVDSLLIFVNIYIYLIVVNYYPTNVIPVDRKFVYGVRNSFEKIENILLRCFYSMKFILNCVAFNVIYMWHKEQVSGLGQVSDAILEVYELLMESENWDKNHILNTNLKSTIVIYNIELSTLSSTAKFNINIRQ